MLIQIKFVSLLADGLNFFYPLENPWSKTISAPKMPILPHIL